LRNVAVRVTTHADRDDAGFPPPFAQGCADCPC
jgi:hypothetical protein